MRVLLLGNPASGSGRGLARTREAERVLRSLSVTVTTVLTERIGHARGLLSPPPRDIDRVVTCGGDGLVSEAAAALRHGDLPLAILPGGRGNDLARALGVPLTVGDAARLAVTGRVTRIDLGSANGRPFCTVAACGLDGEVSRRARGSRLPLPGAGVYVVELLRALRTFRGARAVVDHRGGRVEDDLVVLAVANTPTYGGGFRIAPRARVDDGLLDGCAVRMTSRWRALALFPTIFRGRHESLPEVVMFRSERIEADTQPPLPVEADGELLAATPVSYHVDRAVLPVVVA